MKEKGAYFSSCVGADIHPGLSSIEPKDACGPLGVVGHYDWYRAIQSHWGIQLILVNIHVVEPIGITITAREERTLGLGPLDER